MCDPISIGVLTVASAGFGLHQQRSAAKKQQRFANRAAEQQQKQIHQASSRKANVRARQARAERARLRALSAETGLTGTSIDSVINNADTQAGLDISTIDLNRENQLEDSMLNNQSNLNAIRQPDYLGTALNLGLSLATQGMNANTPTGSTGSTSTAATAGQTAAARSRTGTRGIDNLG